MFKLIPSLNANRSHYETISIDQLIEKIKTSSEPVQKARAVGKTINRTAYDKIKQTSVEAYYPNEFDGISTGYIYLDIDDFLTTQEAIEYRNNLVSKFPKIITLSWLSVSSLGLSILIKTDNLTRTNYNEYWNTLNKLFDYKLDKNSKGYSKVNCISYDDSIYINLNSISLEQYSGGCSSPLFPLNLIRDYCTPLKDDKGVNKGLLHPPMIYIKYHSELDGSLFSNINTPVIIKEGKKVLDIDVRYFWRNRIKVGERNKVISALSMQLIVLNPLPDGYSERTLRSQLLNALLYINQHYTESPLTTDEVIKLFNPNYKKYKQQGYLDVNKYFHKTKYVFWHRDCQIPKHERVSIGLKLLNQERARGKEYNQQLINDAIEMLQDGTTPITRQRIMDVTGLKVYTVKRYWKPFKTIIDEYNTFIASEQKSVDIVNMPTTITDEDLRNYFDSFATFDKPQNEPLYEKEVRCASSIGTYQVHSGLPRRQNLKT